MPDDTPRPRARHARAHVRYAALRALLSTAARWRPLDAPVDGYTFVVGVPWQLWDLVEIPLLSLQRARHPRLVETILAVDATPAQMAATYAPGRVEAVLARFRDLSPRLVHYTRWQSILSRAIDWNWVDCWLTWVLGLAEVRSRYAFLHDFDAVVVDRDFCEAHVALLEQRGAVFAGVQEDPRYRCPDGARLLMTVELLLDAEHLRRTARPLDLFNSVAWVDGASVVYDILRAVQTRVGADRRALHPIGLEQLVHPSQVISQWRALRSQGDGFTPVGYCPLLVIPFFRHVGGDSSGMAEIVAALERGEHVVALEGRRLDLSRLDPAGRQWIVEQLEHLARYFSEAAELEPLVARYCALLRPGGAALA